MHPQCFQSVLSGIEMLCRCLPEIWPAFFQSVLSGIEIAHGVTLFRFERMLSIGPFWNWNTLEVPTLEVPTLAFNRSFLELKYSGRYWSIWTDSGFQSVLSGIEISLDTLAQLGTNHLSIGPFWNWNTLEVPTLEVPTLAFNRSFLELKSLFKGAKDGEATRFQSVLSGIEIWKRRQPSRLQIDLQSVLSGIEISPCPLPLHLPWL